MAWNTLREHGTLKVEKESAPARPPVTVTAILINILNPSCRSLFRLSPQFVSAGDLHRCRTCWN